MDYTDEIVLMRMIAGLADLDIKRKVLGQEDKNLEDTQKFIIPEESGKWSTLKSGPEPEMAAGLSNYKKQQGQPLQKDKNCFKCGKPSHGTDGICPAAKEKCWRCDRIGHFGRVCRSKKDYKSGKEENNALMVEELYFLHNRSGGDKEEGTTQGDLGSGNCISGSTLPGQPDKGKSKILPHMVFNKRLGRYVAK